MFASIVEQPLLLLALLGWLVSLYFGFFRYRQYVWSRNKVRYDLFLKLDQRRAELSSKLLLLLEVGEQGKLAEARVKSLLRRYFQLLLQIDYFRTETGLDAEMIVLLNRASNDDLRQILALRPKLSKLLSSWLDDHNDKAVFTSALIAENTLA